MTTSDRCPCGKPLAHRDADPDSQDWACRVPDPSESSPQSQREAATYRAAWHEGFDAGRDSVLEQLRDELLPQLQKLSSTVAVVAQVFDAIAVVTT